MANVDVQKTLDEAVGEVLTFLTGLDLEYDPAQDRYHTIARALNKALRDVAVEHEWNYFADVEELGLAQEGQQDMDLSPRQRLRIINDDAVRLVTDTGKAVRWAYILPRDAIHKYPARHALWCSVTRSTITFNRPFSRSEHGLRVMAPVMREPRMFKLPPSGQEITRAIRDQLLDFDYPDLVIDRAMYIYAQSDPVMQPRVQTLEANYKDRMYQLVERDERHTDSAYMNDIPVPIEAGIRGSSWAGSYHGHPHANEQWQ